MRREIESSHQGPCLHQLTNEIIMAQFTPSKARTKGGGCWGGSNTPFWALAQFCCCWLACDDEVGTMYMDSRSAVADPGFWFRGGGGGRIQDYMREIVHYERLNPKSLGRQGSGPA